MKSSREEEKKGNDHVCEVKRRTEGIKETRGRKSDETNRKKSRLKDGKHDEERERK